MKIEESNQTFFQTVRARFRHIMKVDVEIEEGISLIYSGGKTNFEHPNLLF